MTLDYDTNRTRHAEAQFGLVGDDNRPGFELLPPQDCISLFLAVMPSREGPLAAVIKPSFP